MTPVVKFFLEVDLPETPDAHLEVGHRLAPVGEDAADLGELMPGDKQEIHDSNSNRVGSWSVEAVTE
jgi:hypothetical protein